MEMEIRQVGSKREMKRFLKLPWSIYKGDVNWVPPMINDLVETLEQAGKPGSKTEFQLFLAYSGGKPAGRIMTGIDRNLNEKKKISMGYFSLFECIDSQEVADRLFDACVQWLGERGIDSVEGPVSPTGTDGDDSKGLLLDCYDRPPVIMNSYNPPYYAKLIEGYGFKKDYDVFAYYLDKESLFKKDPAKIIEYAQKKYGFRVDTLNTADMEKEIKDIKHILDLAVPDEWPDLVPPSTEEVREMAKKLLTLADPKLIAIARTEEEAVGFSVALPDYNQVLIHMNGRLTPVAALKFLWYKRRIKSARIFIMFVIPAYRKKGVSYAIYYKIFKNGTEKNGYTWGEGSTIGETNQRMRADIESFGGQHYKTYRIYKKVLKNQTN